MIDWEHIVEGYNILGAGLKAALPFFLASLMFHKDYLDSNLGNTHPLKRSQVWGSKYMLDVNYRSKISISSNTCNCCTMRATGIPLQWSSNEVIKQLFEKVNYMSNHMSGMGKN